MADDGFEMSNDRRVAPRVDCCGQAVISVLGGKIRATGFILNLSKFGCLIQLMRGSTPVILGDVVEVRFSVWDRDFLVLGDVVSHNRKRTAIAIKFSRMSIRAFETLKELIAELANPSKQDKNPCEYPRKDNVVSIR
jgi:PilZ domain